jgi:TonB family protein
MELLINYIVESGISLTLLTTVYVLFLRKETFFRQNRVFLLASILFSVLLPLIKLPAISSATPVMLSEVTVLPYRNLLSTITIYGKSVSSGFEHAVTSMNIFGYIYISGALLFFIRFAVRVTQVGYLILKNSVQNKDGYKLVMVDRFFSPFSFLNYIFISSLMKGDEDSERMIHHELEHIKQGHTIDILILEILAVFQWFNPFMWLLKRLVRENHEYLADKAVLSKGVNRGWYKQLLLNQYVGQQYIITNSFNYSLIKKRIKMMSKIRSSKLAGFKYISGFIVALALVVGFGCEQKLNLNDEPIFFKVDAMPEFPGGVVEMHKYIATSIQYPATARNNEVEGRVYVSFVIDSKGDVANAKIAKGVDPALNKEALRVIEEMPVWKPGYQQGVPVNVSFTVPINFTLQKKDSNTFVSRDSTNDDAPLFFIVEEMPEYPGGEEALHNYIDNSLNYPEAAKKSGIQGRVYVTFVVDKYGKPVKARIARGVDPSLDREALRIIRNMPTWKPGKQRGKNVNVSFTVPVNFILDKAQK